MVKIKDTNTVFDGLTGEIEKDNGDKVTVLVDFPNGKKVRNDFRKDQLMNIDIEVEDLEIEDEADFDDDICRVLTLTLNEEENDNEFIVKTDKPTIYHDEANDYDWLVLTEDEAYEKAIDHAENWIGDDLYNYDADSLAYCVPSDAFEQDMFDYFYSAYRDDYSDEDLADVLESKGLIDSVDDVKIFDQDWEPDEEYGEDESDRPFEWDRNKMEDFIDNLVEKTIDEFDDSIEWYRQYYGDREFREVIIDSDLVDVRQLAEGRIQDMESVAWELDWRGDGTWYELRLDDGTYRYAFPHS